MSALLSVGARLATMVVSLVCGVISARLVIDEAGVDRYALLTLLIALPSLISFTDLGAGAVVVNSVATSPDVRIDETVLRQALSVSRVILMFAAAVALVDIVLAVTGGWHWVLGNASSVPHSTQAATACLFVFCLTITLGLWQRILLGLGRNPVIILLQGLISPVSLLIVLILLRTGSTTALSFLALGTFLASLTTAVCGTLIAARLTRPLMLNTLRQVFLPRRFPGARVMHVGWPMLAQLLAAPLSITLPRYLLAQTADHVELAQYALAGQIFFSLQALVSAAGVSLWPAFTKARAQGTIKRGPAMLSLAFALALASATLVVIAIGPWFFAIVSNGEVEVPTGIVLAFGLMVTMQSVLFPIGMFIMDPPGIRFQVLPSILAAVMTVLLTIVLTPRVGVVGPLLSNAIATLVCQIVPYAFYIQRHRARLYGAGPSVVAA